MNEMNPVRPTGVTLPVAAGAKPTAGEADLFVVMLQQMLEGAGAPAPGAGAPAGIAPQIVVPAEEVRRDAPVLTPTGDCGFAGAAALAVRDSGKAGDAPAPRATGAEKAEHKIDTSEEASAPAGSAAPTQAAAPARGSAGARQRRAAEPLGETPAPVEADKNLTLVIAPVPVDSGMAAAALVAPVAVPAPVEAAAAQSEMAPSAGGQNALGAAWQPPTVEAKAEPPSRAARPDNKAAPKPQSAGAFPTGADQPARPEQAAATPPAATAAEASGTSLPHKPDVKPAARVQQAADNTHAASSRAQHKTPISSGHESRGPVQAANMRATRPEGERLSPLPRAEVAPTSGKRAEDALAPRTTPTVQDRIIASPAEPAAGEPAAVDPAPTDSPGRAAAPIRDASLNGGHARSETTGPFMAQVQQAPTRQTPARAASARPAPAQATPAGGTTVEHLPTGEVAKRAAEPRQMAAQQARVQEQSGAPAPVTGPARLHAAESQGTVEQMPIQEKPGEPQPTPQPTAGPILHQQQSTGQTTAARSPSQPPSDVPAAALMGETHADEHPAEAGPVRKRSIDEVVAPERPEPAAGPRPHAATPRAATPPSSVVPQPSEGARIPDVPPSTVTSQQGNPLQTTWTPQPRPPEEAPTVAKVDKRPQPDAPEPAVGAAVASGSGKAPAEDPAPDAEPVAVNLPVDAPAQSEAAGTEWAGDGVLALLADAAAPDKGPEVAAKAPTSADVGANPVRPSAALDAAAPSTVETGRLEAAARPGVADPGRVNAEAWAPAVGQAVINRLVQAARRGERDFRMNLRPAELGGVHAHLSMRGAGLTLTLTTETAQAQQALEQAVPELRRDLQGHGLTLEQCSVQCGVGDGPRDGAGAGASGQYQPSEQQSWRTSQRESAEARPTPHDPTGPGPTLRRHGRNGASVDVMI